MSEAASATAAAVYFSTLDENFLGGQRTGENRRGWRFALPLQGDPFGQIKPPVDLVPTVLAVGGPLLLLPSA